MRLDSNSQMLFQVRNEDTDTKRILSSVRAELQPESAYDNFRPNGFNAQQWAAITRKHSVLSGPLRLDFAQIDTLLELLCGVPTSDSVNTGVRTRVYELPATGGVTRPNYSARYGLRDKASVMANLLLQALSINFMRMTDNNEGSVTLLADKPSTDSGALLGNSTQNEVQRYVTGAAYGGGAISIVGPSATASITPGTDNAAAIQEKLATAFGVTSGHIVVTGITSNEAATVVEVAGFTGEDAGYNGVYTTDDTENGAPLYALDESHILVFNDDQDMWVFGAFRGSSGTGSPDSNWRAFAAGDNSGVPESGWHNSNGTRIPTVNEADLTAILDIYATFSGATAQSREWALPTTSTAGVKINRIQDGSNGVLTVPASVPVLPQMWSARYASTIGGLSSAAPIMQMRGLSAEFPDLLTLLWHHVENSINPTDYVEGESDITFHVIVANDTASGSVVADLMAKAEANPSTPQAWQFLAKHPGNVYSLKLEGMFAVGAAVPYSVDNNVRYRDFPLTLQLNDQRWVLRITLTTPG